MHTGEDCAVSTNFLNHPWVKMVVWKTGEKLCEAISTDTFLLAEEQNNLIILTVENTAMMCL
jgi:hypothetical protein